MSTSFGAKLRELRAARGLTQEQLAEISGVQLWTLRGYEQDYRGPNWRKFLDICKGLGVDPMDFDGCDPEAESAPAPRGKPKKK